MGERAALGADDRTKKSVTSSHELVLEVETNPGALGADVWVSVSQN